MTLDYRMVQRAARRVGGVKFRLAGDLPRGRYRGHCHRLTWGQVCEARAWAAGEGGDRPRMAQARALAARYGVAPDTMRAVLVNDSWYDPAYQPAGRAA